VAKEETAIKQMTASLYTAEGGVDRSTAGGGVSITYGNDGNDGCL